MIFLPKCISLPLAQQGGYDASQNKIKLSSRLNDAWRLTIDSSTISAMNTQPSVSERIGYSIQFSHPRPQLKFETFHVFCVKKNNVTHLAFRCWRIVVLYGCETWLLTLREERRLRVFENRVFRRIFGPRRDEVTREWRKLHNKELLICIAQPILFG